MRGRWIRQEFARWTQAGVEVERAGRLRAEVQLGEALDSLTELAPLRTPGGLVLCDCERGHIVALARIDDRAARACPLCERDDARDAERRSASRLVDAMEQIKRMKPTTPTE